MRSVRIHYDGKMTDLYPAWVWQVVTEYLYDPFDYTKVNDYLKKLYGKQRPRIYFATIEEIVKAPSVTKPGLTAMHLSTGKSSKNGVLYYFRLETSFEIGKKEDHYRIKQEGLIWISEVMSQVLERKVKFYSGDQLILEM